MKKHQHHVENDNFEKKSAENAGNSGQEGCTCENCDCVDESTYQSKIAELEEQINTLKDTVLRKVAEMENLKKRCEREKNDAISYANTKFAKDLLGVLDNFDRIIENSTSASEKISADPNLKAIFEGISLCNKELVTVLQRHGVNLVKAEQGTPFNPQFHQAMCEVEAENVESGTIVEIFQKGYSYNDRLLRPSMVSVAKKK